MAWNLEETRICNCSLISRYITLWCFSLDGDLVQFVSFSQLCMISKVAVQRRIFIFRIKRWPLIAHWLSHSWPQKLAKTNPIYIWVSMNDDTRNAWKFYCKLKIFYLAFRPAICQFWTTRQQLHEWPIHLSNPLASESIKDNSFLPIFVVSIFDYRRMAKSNVFCQSTVASS